MPEPRKSRYPGCYPSGNSSWQYKLRLPPDPLTGKRRMETRGGFASDLEAHTARSARLVELGLGVNTSPSDLTITEAVEQWVAGRAMKPNTRYNYGKLTERYITPHIGALKVKDLTPARVRQWQVMLSTTGRRRGSGGLAPSTVNLTRALLASTFHQLHRDGALARNVVAMVDGVPMRAHQPQTWSDAEMRAFLAVSDNDDYAALWRLCLLSLLRPGEAIALRWQDVNLAARTVAISQTLTRDTDGRPASGDPKTPTSAATVGFSVETAAHLQRLQDTQRFAVKYLPSHWRTDIVFPNRNGKMFGAHQQLNDRLRRLCVAAGVPVLTAHELRHTGASAMMRAGVDPATLQRTLRHTSPVFSLKVYAQQGTAQTTVAVETLEQTIREQGDDTSSSITTAK